MRDGSEVFAFFGLLIGMASGWAIGAGVTENSWRNKLVDRPAQIEAIKSEVLAIRAREKSEKEIERSGY